MIFYVILQPKRNNIHFATKIIFIMKPFVNLRYMLLTLLASILFSTKAAAQEAYAVYTKENRVLTFYYDNSRNSRPGTSYDLNIGPTTLPQWHEDGTYYQVQGVRFDPSFAEARPTTTSAWFYEMSNLTFISGVDKYLNTSEVESMLHMFSGCWRLSSVDVSNFDTSKVTMPNSMFYGCSSLESLDLSSFSTASFTDMAYMFSGCSGLNTIYVGDDWNVENVRTTASMFEGCTSLVGGAGTTFDADHTDKAYAHVDGGAGNPGYLTLLHAYVVLDGTTLTFYYDAKEGTRTGSKYTVLNGALMMANAFGYLKSATEAVFDPSFINVSPTNTVGWFFGLENLKSITGIDYLNTSKVRKMNEMFRGCSSLESIDLSNFNTENVVDMSRMFNDCSSLVELNLVAFDTRNVLDMRYMFAGCSNLTTIYVGEHWTVDNVELSDDMFLDCFSIVGSLGTTYDTVHTNADWAYPDMVWHHGYLTQFKSYVVYDNGTLTFYYGLPQSSDETTVYQLNSNDNVVPDWYLYGVSSNVTLVRFDPSFKYARPTTTSLWFAGMNQLTDIEGMAEYLNTSEVTNMAAMFNGCKNLWYIELSGFDTRNVVSMDNMFGGCSSLGFMDVTSFDTRNVRDMYAMFSGCANVDFFNLTNFDTRNVELMDYMFLNCYKAKEIDMSSFDTQKVTSMSGMFECCFQLRNLDLTHFDTRNVTDMSEMFVYCNELAKIYVGNEWNTANVTESRKMFDGCDALIGSAGTTYDENHVDANYAHLDGGNGAPGYLSMMPYVEIDGTTLTFYSDGKRSQHAGTTYDLNYGLVQNHKYPEWRFDNADIKRVVFDASFKHERPVSTTYWFSTMYDLATIEGMKENLNTSAVIDMNQMFMNCSSLESLDLSSFDTRKTESMNSMFALCENLKTITVGENWSTESLSWINGIDMFRNCTSLVGGAGTTYDADHTDAAYAHVDGGPGNPGYFTGSFVLKGDVNGDAQVGIGDIVAITNVMAGIETNPNIVSRADVNGDNQVGIGDIVAVTNIMAGIE